MKNIKLGTRKSPLALAQAQQVRLLLIAAHPDISVEIVHIVTSGDKFLNQPLADIGGKGLFTKEIEEGLLEETLDIAVHSMKDVPTKLPDGLVIGALLTREDPRDMLIGAGLAGLADLSHGAVFGTSSLRRAAQVKIIRPDVQIVPFRGNVQTRLAKLERGEAQATMLAKAGLNRLGINDVEGVVLSVEEFLPAIAQGAVGIECRENDTKIRELLAPLNDVNTQIAVDCERAFLRVLDGSCRTPISGYAIIENLSSPSPFFRERVGVRVEPQTPEAPPPSHLLYSPPSLTLPLAGRGDCLNDNIFMRGLIAKSDGSSFRVGELRGSVKDAQAIGVELGNRLLKS